MGRESVIRTAESQIGKTEYPKDSNLTAYGAEYGLNGYPWCVMFLWWCFRKAGETEAFFGGGKTASCGQLLRYYRERGQTAGAYEAEPGDILILNFSGTEDTEHCGIVTKNLGGGRYQTVEGNTSPGAEGSQDNGGSVAVKTRYGYQVVGVCRPKYRDEPESDWKDHWAEESIRWAIETGIMQGYPDGSFLPDQAMTRAELATTLKRFAERDEK